MSPSGDELATELRRLGVGIRALVDQRETVLQACRLLLAALDTGQAVKVRDAADAVRAALFRLEGGR